VVRGAVTVCEVNHLVCGNKALTGPRLALLVFSNSVGVLFTSRRVKNIEELREKWFHCLCPRKLESLTISRCNHQVSTFCSVINVSWVFIRSGLEPLTSRTLVWHSYNWANRSAIIYFPCWWPLSKCLSSPTNFKKKKKNTKPETNFKKKAIAVIPIIIGVGT